MTPVDNVLAATPCQNGSDFSHEAIYIQVVVFGAIPDMLAL